MSVQIIFNYPTSIEAKEEVLNMAKLFCQADQQVLAKMVPTGPKPANPVTKLKALEAKYKAEKAAKAAEAKDEAKDEKAPPAQAQEQQEQLELPGLEAKAPGAEEISKEKAFEKLQAVNKEKGLAAAVACLKTVGATKFSDITPDKYPAFVQAANAALGEAADF